MIWIALGYISVVYGFLFYINLDLWRFFRDFDQDLTSDYEAASNG